MATMTKTTKAGEIEMNALERAHSDTLTGRAPKAYREATLTAKALQWAAGEPVEALAQVRGKWMRGPSQPKADGVTRTFKLSGIGSYQKAILYESTSNAGRERFRGTCQVCAGKQVVQENRVVLHGYTRPGDGMIFGKCPGQHAKPAEQSLVLTHQILENLRLAEQTHTELLRLAVEALEGIQQEFTARDYTGIEKADWARLREAETGCSNQRNILWHTEAYRTTLVLNVVPRFGADLYREVVAL